MSEHNDKLRLRALVKLGEEERELEVEVPRDVENIMMNRVDYSMGVSEPVHFVSNFEERVEEWFTYHPPRDDEQLEKYRSLRAAGKQLALIIAREVPACADRDVAIVKVREAVMFANAAIACSTK